MKRDQHQRALGAGRDGLLRCADVRYPLHRMRPPAADRRCAASGDAGTAALDVADGTARPVARAEAWPVSDFDALLLAVLAVIGLAAALALLGVLKVELKRPTNRQQR